MRKINTQVKSYYNIESVEVINRAVKLKKECIELREKASELRRMIPPTNDEIMSVNYNKTHEISAAMIKKLKLAEAQLDSVIQSGQYFAEKVEKTKRIRFPEPR